MAKKATLTDDGNIVHVTVPLDSGHIIQLFCNRCNSQARGQTLTVVDVVHRNGRGGNEIHRKYFYPDIAVAFANNLPEAKDE